MMQLEPTSEIFSKGYNPRPTRAHNDVLIEPIAGLMDGLQNLHLSGRKRPKHGCTNLILNEAQILEVKIAKRQARLDSHMQVTQRMQGQLETMRQHFAGTHANGLSERESQRLRDLEESFQQRMQAAAAEWQSREESKMEAEIERRASEMLQQRMNAPAQLQTLPVQAALVGSPNVIQNVSMENALSELSLDCTNRTRKQQRVNKSIIE